MKKYNIRRKGKKEFIIDWLYEHDYINDTDPVYSTDVFMIDLDLDLLALAELVMNFEKYFEVDLSYLDEQFETLKVSDLIDIVKQPSRQFSEEKPEYVNNWIKENILK